jgi:hypothetical protein
MGGIAGRRSPQELDGLIGVATAPGVIDVRLPNDFDADDAQIVGTVHAFLRIYGISSPALDRLAAIVRGDTARRDLTPQSHGPLAFSQGFKTSFADDHAPHAQDTVRYGLYVWSRIQEPWASRA